MAVRWIALAALMLAGGAAEAQELPKPLPLYEQVMAAVQKVCVRKETQTFIGFVCEDDNWIFFFTLPGRPEHPGYYATSVARAPTKTEPRLYREPEGADSWKLGSGFGQFRNANHEATRAWVESLPRNWR